MPSRILSRLTALVTFSAVVMCFAAEGSTFDSTSLDSAITQLVERTRLKGTEGNPTSLDSMLIFVDSMQHLASLGSGQIDTVYAIASFWRAWVAIHRGEDSSALRLLDGAVQIWRSIWGDNCPQQAAAMRLLGDLYLGECRYTEAEETYRRAISILQNAPPYNGIFRSQWMLGLLYNNCGSVHRRAGDYDSAKVLYSQALDAWSIASPPESSGVAAVLQNLGELAWIQGDYATAESFVKRAIDMHEHMPSEQRLWATPIDEAREVLGFIWVALGKFREADSLLDLSVAGYRKANGQSAFDNQTALANASYVARRCRNWIKALGYSEEVVELDERFGSQYLANRSRHLEALAIGYFALHKWDQSRAALEKGMLLRQSFLRGAFSYASERTKIRYLGELPAVSDLLLSLAVQDHESLAIQSALQNVLSGKAILLDALSAERRVAFCSDQAGLKDLAEQYASVCSSIADLVVQSRDFGGRGAMDLARSLYKRKDSLELELSKRCSEYISRSKDSAASTKDVSRALAPGSVLWELVQFNPYSPANPDSLLPAHYVAFSLDVKGQSTATDLGPASVIDSLVSAVHREIMKGSGALIGVEERQLEEDMAAVSSQLSALVLDPLLKTASGCDRIIVSPDGQLSLLPFEILPMPDGRYAIEQYEFSYLSTGRDLLDHSENPSNQATGAVVVAAPDFESTSQPLLAQMGKAIQGVSVTQFRGPSDRTECLTTPFNRLPAAEREGQLVADLLRTKMRDQVLLLSGSDASEDALKRLLHPPRVLHLATHGYFCSKASYSEISQMTESPLLYSGVALAGSNRTIENPGNTAGITQDGILTALEVSGLNLTGTDLAVLGSCRAGMGPVLQGEGVYGLKRAFQLAGARTIIMSMFDVPDMTARNLMTRFYTDWLSGTSKSKALRSAMLAELQQRRQQHGAAHPLFWGGFVLTGDYR